MLRVLNLPFNLASQAGILSSALNDSKIKSSSAYKSSHMSEYKPDFELSGTRIASILRRINCFIRSVGRFDVYLHHTGGSLLSHHLGYLDAKINAKLGKTCIPIFHGSELRQPSIENKRNPYYENPYNEDDKRAIELLEFWSSISNHAVICDPSFLDYGLNKYFDNVHYIPIAIDLSRYQETDIENLTSTNRKKKVVHLPSHPTFKGSRHIRKAIDALKADGVVFDYHELSGIPHSQIKKEILSADLVIDQMMVGSYGVLALEAMALKKPVLGYIIPSTIKNFYEGLPIINCNADTLKSILSNWLSKDESEYQYKGQESYQYVKKYHDSKVVSSRFQEIFLRTRQ